MWVDQNDVLKIANKHHIWHGFSQTDRIKEREKGFMVPVLVVVVVFFFGSKIAMLKIDISFTNIHLNFVKLKVIGVKTLQFELKENSDWSQTIGTVFFL